MTVLGPDTPRFPIGLSDYASLRRDGYTYVDKTRFIAQVIDAPGQTKLIPRPRRFGKTLNMSMLRYFFERSDDDRGDLFEDTWIWTAEDGRFREHFQRYPVIYLTFKDVKGRTWDESWVRVRRLLNAEVRRLDRAGHIDLEDTGDIDARQRMVRDAGEPIDFVDALTLLVEWSGRATDEKVVILIDEYDATLHAAWEHGYWNEAIAFFRDFLSGGFKDASSLYRGVMTGILKVAKENVFSGLNNVDTYSLFSPYLSTEFGFTTEETEALASSAGLTSELATMAEWYNGYRFGGIDPTTMYNPWSILQYLSKPRAGPLPYWKNTSSNALVRDLLVRNARAVGPDVSALLNGESIDKRIDENVVLSSINNSSGALWSLLAFSGYLTAEQAAPTAEGFDVSLRIPNREVEAVFRSTFTELLRQSADGEALAGLVDAMLAGDSGRFERELGALLAGVMSYHDFGRRPIESVYHAFIVGLLVSIEATHIVRSNRESGTGRADVLVFPREGGTGVVLELKTVDTLYDETPETALDAAVEQIVSRDYATEVRAFGASTVHQYGVVFDGKRCWVRMVE